MSVHVWFRTGLISKEIPTNSGTVWYNFQGTVPWCGCALSV